MESNLRTVVQMSDVHVQYGLIHALQGVDFNLLRGEIHGLVGEHRAGKSTLVKLLSGAVQKQHGTIAVKGRILDRITPLMAKQLGITLNYQFLNVIPSLNAIENMFSGRLISGPLGFIRKRQMEDEVRSILVRMNLNIDIRCPLEFLQESEKHLVELGISLIGDPDIVIFDEISTKLTPEEMERIYDIIQDFKTAGKSIIYITHNMDEIFRIADRVTILRAGRRCGTEEIGNLDRIKLIKLTYTFVRSRQDLEEDNRELHVLKSFNEAIMDSIPVGFLLLDKNNTIILSNLEARKTVCSDNSSEIDLLSWIECQAWFEGEEILNCVDNHLKGEWDGLKTFDQKILSIRTSPYRNDDFKFVGTIVIIQDQTEQTSLNDYLIRTEKIASVAELAAGVAHEVNNPLGTILNYLNILGNFKKSFPEKTILGKIESEILRIGDITKSLLTFSRTKNLDEPIDMGYLIKDSLLLIGHLADMKHVKIDAIYPEKQVMVPGSFNQMKQVILNLCKNAIEAVLENGIIRVLLEIDPSENRCRVIVEDNGMGVPPGNEYKIFNPFFTTKVSKDNAGLGLSVSQYIIEAHRGMIQCKSSGNFTQMVISLPTL